VTARGKHENPGKSAKNTKHVPKHGGPQTGTGYTAGGSKPDKVEDKKPEDK
jgi:hypothetical protein